MPYAIAPLVGALITVMNGINSRFSETAGYFLAVPVIHVAGLATVTLVLLVRPEARKPGRLPFYYYSGGVFGILTVFASSYSFAALGASFAVALSLVGQALFSIGADATGLLGRERYPLTIRSLPGLLLSIGGAAVMVGDWKADAPAMLAALASGAVPGFTFILNSELGRKKGLFRSVRVNYVAGLAASLLVLIASGQAAASFGPSLARAGAGLCLGGGIMGVAVVASMNYILPRAPAFYATLLAFSGQALAGLAIDFAAAGLWDWRKLIGTGILLAGLGINAILTRNAAGRARDGAVIPKALP
jgi:transporter family-2 protein